MADLTVKKITDLTAATSIASSDQFVIVDMDESVAANKTKKLSANLVKLFNAAQITDGIIADSKLATDSVTTSKIKAANVTGAKIASKTITAANIADNTITNSQLASGVALANIGSKGITNAYIADNTITASQIATNGVGNAEIANGAVSPVKTNFFGGTAIYWGSVAANGTGVYLPSGWTVSRLSVGHYRVNHPSWALNFPVVSSQFLTTVNAVSDYFLVNTMNTNEFVDVHFWFVLIVG